MATIEELVKRGELFPLEIRLPRNAFVERWLYLSPQCRAWVFGELKTLQPVDTLQIRPAQQFYDLLLEYITGRPLDRPRQFRQMKPDKHDVYELKTIDVRLYGWFVRPRTFIAARGDSMENTHSQDGLATSHKNYAMSVREQLDLDEPKCAWGAAIDDLL